MLSYQMTMRVGLKNETCIQSINRTHEKWGIRPGDVPKRPRIPHAGHYFADHGNCCCTSLGEK